MKKCLILLLLISSISFAQEFGGQYQRIKATDDTSSFSPKLGRILLYAPSSGDTLVFVGMSTYWKQLAINGAASILSELTITDGTNVIYINPDSVNFNNFYRQDTNGNIGINTAPQSGIAFKVFGNFILTGGNISTSTNQGINWASNGAHKLGFDASGGIVATTIPYLLCQEVGANSRQTVTLGVGVTTLALTSNVVFLTGDGGGNTIATFTDATIGVYTFIFTDANITITDTDAHTTNTIDLVGTATDFTSADDTTLMLCYDGTSWYEVSRSTN